MARDKNGKKPKATTGRGGKQPRSVLSATNEARVPRSETFTPFQLNPVWAFRIIDLGGPWCWSKMQAAEIFTVFDKLRNFESMTWKEIHAGTGSHRVEPWQIGKEARDRLVEISQDDAEVLVSLRIDGPGRVWGIMDQHVLRILWWDPDHQVYPVEKKHT